MLRLAFSREQSDCSFRRAARGLDADHRRHHLTTSVTWNEREGAPHGGLDFRHGGSPVASNVVSPAATASKIPCDPRTGITPILRFRMDWSSLSIVQSISVPRRSTTVSPTFILTVLLLSSRVI